VRYISTPEDRTQTRITRNRVPRTVALLLFLLIKEQNISIDLGQNKRRGVEYIKPFRQMLYNIQKHQVAFLSGAAEAFATERQILEDIRSAREVDGRYGKEFRTIHGLAGSAEK
jgi:cytochrome c-type biogenesis protein CcmH/NrfG